MVPLELKNKYYQALLEKDTEYEGLFYVGVKTTGVFCRPTCTARKPKFENCEFFETAEQALLASFRPCKRCRPLSHPAEVSELVSTLVDAVEANPEKRWKDADFKELEHYFQCGQKKFNTPIVMLGSDFQKNVWQTLMKIPPGETRSYTDIAKTIKQPSACRAVARANGVNQLAIIIPCHRVINSDGELGGYGGGLTRKAWLINHEKIE